jgi:5-methylcytosine-specific restriction protein A
MSTKPEVPCPLCGRAVPNENYWEKHHLVPRAKGGKETERICVDCGNQVHELFSNNELRDTYNTIDALRKDERVWRWVKWVRKQKNFGICMKKKKRKL